MVVFAMSVESVQTAGTVNNNTVRELDART